MLLSIELEDVVDGKLLERVEYALYKQVMEHCRYNQSRAAKLLGISRGTLRAKLKEHYGNKYAGTRGENTWLDSRCTK